MPRDCEAILPERVAGQFTYDPLTGAIHRMHSKRSDAIGPVPTIRHSNGYLVVYAFGRLIRAHRLAWVLMTGSWPVGDVDHINGDKADNRWENLRAATRAQNLRNVGTRSHSATGIKGVAAHGRRFVAYISVNRKKKHLGVFDTAAEAHAAYLAAARAEAGEFANPGDSP